MSNKQSETNEEKEEHTITNTNLIYDRDDSLNDVISFGKQTPFRLGSQLISQVEDENNEDEEIYEEEDEEDEDEEPNEVIEVIEDDLIDQDYLNNNEFLNTLARQEVIHSNLSSNDMILNLKDTTIDEIYLIPESIKKKFLFRQTNEPSQHTSETNLVNLNETKPNFIYQTPPATSRQRLSNSGSRIASVRKITNTKSDSKLNSITKSPSRIPVAKSTTLTPRRPQSRLSFSNLDPHATNLSSSNLNDSNQVFTPKAPSLKLSSSTNQINKSSQQQSQIKSKLSSQPAKPKTARKNEGAFKYYSNKDNSRATPTTKTTSKPVTKTTDKNRTSPFRSINTDSNAKSKQPSGESKLKKQSHLSSRPATTTTNLNYSVDSDESICLDNLLSNPAELKRRLKEGKMDKEQLGQLQQNYLNLLEQYAEKENFIDKFRLGYNDWANYNSNPLSTQINTNQFSKIVVQTPSPKSTELLFQTQQTSQQFQNASNDALKAIDSAIDTYQQNSSPNFKSFTPNNELFSNSNASNQQQLQQQQQQPQQGVFLITTSNSRDRVGSSSNCNLITPVNQAESPSEQIEENILVETNSKLGILLQTKVLEDKMQSFVTLINEKQLTQVEQKQVFDSIRTDYENLLKNYQEVKRNDTSGILPSELDMDIDLNKELDKMKDLLNNIVEKMNTNQAEITLFKSEMPEEFNAAGSRTSVSSYTNNNDEIMNQYSRLLDVFNRSSSPKSTPMNNNEDKINAKMKKSSSGSSLQRQPQSRVSNLANNNKQKQIKLNLKSPKRTKQQLTPSNTSSESNNTSKKFIQLNERQLQQQQQKRQPLSNQETTNINNNLIRRPIQQQIYDEENQDETDYNDIIEVESGLLDNSFINDDEDFNQLDSSFKEFNNIRKTNFDEIQLNTESEYENYYMSSTNPNQINTISNTNMIVRTSSSSNYKSSSSSSSCQPAQNYPQILINSKQRVQEQVNPTSRQQKSISMPAPYQWDAQYENEDEEQESTVLHVNNDSQRRNNKQLQQQQSNRNSFNPSSSSSSNSLLVKPSSSVENKRITPKKSSSTRIQPVAKAYEGSESDELLESFTNQSERDYESVATIRTVTNEANKRLGQNYHQQAQLQLNSKPPTMIRSINGEMKSKEKSSKHHRNCAKHEQPRRFSSYESQTNDVPRSDLIKFDQLSEFSHSTEISGSVVELTQKKKTKTSSASSRTTSSKAELMKQLAEEVESLKQQILKKHLGKLRENQLKQGGAGGGSSSSSNSNINEERKKIRKSQSYQSYQALNEEVAVQDKLKISKAHESTRRYTTRIAKVSTEKTPAEQKHIPNSKSLDNFTKNHDTRERKSTKEETRQHQQQQQQVHHKTNQTEPLDHIPVQTNPFCVNSNNLLCYDTQGRLVTILANNPLFLNRNSFPLNEINQNIIEQQTQTNIIKSNSPPAAFNHMQTQTQPLEPVSNLILAPNSVALSAQVAHLPVKQHQQQTQQQPPKIPIITNIPPQKYYAQPVYNQNAINTSTNSHHSKRKIRYYIREYADASAASDCESTYNRNEESMKNEENAKSNGHLRVTISNKNNSKENPNQQHEFAPTTITATAASSSSTDNSESNCNNQNKVENAADKNLATEDANKLEKMFKKAFKYAHSLNEKSKKIKNKILILNSINV